LTTRSASLFLVSLAFFAGCSKDLICTETEEVRGDVCAPIGDTDVAGPAVISVDPCDIDFGSVSVNTTTSQTVKISNTGGESLVVSSIVASEPFSSQATAASINGGSQYQFAVRFTPTTYGDFEGTLTIASNDAANPSTVCTLRGSVLGDVDGDGFVGAEGGGEDCDDNDATSYPGAAEVWYNGNDENCDGASDYDQDGDGYESSVYNPDPTAAGGDCQDRKTDINPGVDEVYYDGIDSDCDGGNDYDADGDGEKSDLFGGTDCNDLDASVNTAGVEAYDGLDNNCDGAIDNGVQNTEDDITLTGSDVTQAMGSAIAVGDFDDDGVDEIVVGMKYYNYSSTGRPDAKGDAGGAFAVFLAEDIADGLTTDSAESLTEGEYDVDELGASLAVAGDVDEDGILDLAVGASSRSPDGTYGANRAGSVYLFSGPDVAGGDVRDARFSIVGGDGHRLGLSVGAGFDVDADGAGDIVAYGVDTYYGYNYLALQYGGSEVSGDYAWSDIDATFRGKCVATISSGAKADNCVGSVATEQGGSKYWPMSAGGRADFNNDGYDDVLMADPYWDLDDGSTGSANRGRVWALSGTSSRYQASNASVDGSARVLFTGSAHKQYLGQSVGVVPAADGEASGLVVADADAGMLYYFQGSSELMLGGLDLTDDADAVLEISNDFNAFIDIGDWTGDGRHDVGALSADGNVAVLLDPSAWMGAMGDVEANGSVLASIEGGDGYSDFGGAGPAFAGDLNGDDRLDLVVSDWGYDDERGSVHIFFNPE
jgi:hypothetical protein